MTQITCEASVLAKALRDVAQIVTSDKTLPILANVLIEGGKDTVTITASTMDIMLSRTIAGEVKKAGAFTVPATKFREIMSAMPTGSLAQMVADAGTMNLVCARSKFKFGTLPATDFPKLPFTDKLEKPLAVIEAGKDFVDALACVRHAFATDTTQYWLCGAFIQKLDGNLRMIGLDALRLSMRRLGPIDADIPDTIMGAASVNILLRLAGDFDRAIAVEFAEGRLRFTLGDTQFVAKTVDATYPKFDHIIPVDPPLMAKVDTKFMLSALSRIQILSDDKERTVRLSFTRDMVTIENRGAGDHGIEEIPCDYAGDDLSIAFRGQQLRDGLEAMGTETVGIGMSGPLAPMLMTGRDDATIVISAMRS